MDKPEGAEGRSRLLAKITSMSSRELPLQDLPLGASYDFVHNVLQSSTYVESAIAKKFKDVNRYVLVTGIQEIPEGARKHTVTSIQEHNLIFENSVEVFLDVLRKLYEDAIDNMSNPTSGVLAAMARGPKKSATLTHQVDLLFRLLCNFRSLQVRATICRHAAVVLGAHPTFVGRLDSMPVPDINDTHTAPWAQTFKEVSTIDNISLPSLLRKICKGLPASTIVDHPVVVCLPNIMQDEEPGSAGHNVQIPGSAGATVQSTPGSAGAPPSQSAQTPGSAGMLLDDVSAFKQALILSAGATLNSVTSASGTFMCIVREKGAVPFYIQPLSESSPPQPPLTPAQPVAAQPIVSQPEASGLQQQQQKSQGSSQHTPANQVHKLAFMALAQLTTRSPAQDEAMRQSARQLTQDELMDIRTQVLKEGNVSPDVPAILDDLFQVRATLGKPTDIQHDPSKDQPIDYKVTEHDPEHPYDHEDPEGVGVDYGEHEAELEGEDDPQQEDPELMQPFADRIGNLERIAKLQTAACATLNSRMNAVEGIVRELAARADNPQRQPDGQHVDNTDINRQLDVLQQIRQNAPIQLGQEQNIHYHGGELPISPPAAASAPVVHPYVNPIPPLNTSHRTVVKATEPKLAKHGDVRDYFVKLEIYYNLTSTPEHEKISRALLNIESSEIVDMWLSYVACNPNITPTFELFKEQITIFAGGHSVTTKALDDLANCKQGKQDMDKYIKRYNSLVTAAKLPFDSPLVINGFLRGVTDNTFRTLISLDSNHQPWQNLSKLQHYASLLAVSARPTTHLTTAQNTPRTHLAKTAKFPNKRMPAGAGGNRHFRAAKKPRQSNWQAYQGQQGYQGQGRGRGRGRGAGQYYQQNAGAQLAQPAQPAYNPDGPAARGGRGGGRGRGAGYGGRGNTNQ
jgi:hypothetical protein